VDNQDDLPKVYLDQNNYIHFETKNFHVWSKILLTENEATDLMKFLKKYYDDLKSINS